MKKRILWLMIVLFGFTGIQAQNSEQVLMTVGNENVTLSEFETIFRKNNLVTPITKEALDEYIDLFVKFKLKVREAKELQMDTAKTFVNELNGYVRQLAQPYLKDKNAEEFLVKEAYERLGWDLKVRHIVVQVGECAPPKDTLAAWNKIEKIRKDILKTKNFEEAAKKYSEDTVSNKVGGELGYFTALVLSYPFENAAYGLQPGEVSKPVRTKYGYHLLKVDEKRPARGRVRVAHIYIQANKEGDQGAYELASRRIEEAYYKLQTGEDFASVAKTYSEDYNSAGKGGELAPFGINQMVQEFEDAAFGLKAPGDYTKPFETSLGFHIVKLIEKLPRPSYEEYKGELTKAVQKNKRWDSVKDAFTKKLKTEYTFEENRKFISDIEAEAAKSNNMLNGEQLESFAKTDWMFRINGKPYPANDLINGVIGKLPVSGTIDVCTFMKNHYQPYLSQKLLDYKEANLPNEYPDFKLLVNEYRDGILLFNLMDQKVWTKSVKDTSGLQAFHAKNQANYMWPERVHLYTIDVKNEEAEKLARKLAPKLIAGKMTKDQFLATVNKKVKDNIFVYEAMYTKEDNNPRVAQIGWNTGISATEKKDGVTRFYVIDRIVPPMGKSLKEAKGAVISDYQEYLEKEWIKELEAKYPVQINKQVLYSLVGSK